MDDTFTIEFPNDVPDSELEIVRAELTSINEVQDAGSMRSRSIDAQSLMLWVSVATGVLGVVKTGVPLIQSITGMFRSKGIKGAKITLANGTSFTADEISPEDLEKLLASSKGQ